MTLVEYLRVFKNRWLFIVGASVLGLLLAAVYSWSITPVYSASTQLFVTTSGGDSSITSLQQGSTFTQQRVKSYAAIITAPDVLDPVISELGLTDVSQQELATRISASSPVDTVLLDVRVSDTSPQRAADIANGVSLQFTNYVTKLELPSGSGTSPVKVTVTTPAVVPGAPDSPRKSLDLAIGLFLGVGLGLGGAVLADSLDRTIGGRHEAGEIMDAPVLTAILDDPTVKADPLNQNNQFSPRSEAYRQLRTNIRFLNVDREVHSLVVTSSVAEEGKSTSAANLAVTMAQSGEAVVLIDADLRRPQVDQIFGLSNGVGLTSVLLGDVMVETAMQRWRDDLDLHVLTSGPVPPNPSELIGSHKMAETIRQLVASGHVVVVDSPPLLPVTDAAILARVTDGALVVTKAKSTRIEQLAGAREVLQTAGAVVLGVVVNCVPKSGAYRGSYDAYETYTSESVSPKPAVVPVKQGAPEPVGSGGTRLGTPMPMPPRQDVATASSSRQRRSAGSQKPHDSDA